VRRLLFPVVAVVSVALAVGLILGFSVPSNAATIGSDALSNAAFRTELTTVSASTPYLCYLNASLLSKSNGLSGLGPVYAANNNGWATTYASTLLGQRVVDETIVQWAKNHPSDLVVTKAQATADLIASMDAAIGTVAGSSYACQYTGTQTLGSMPSDFINQQISAEQASESFLVTHGGIGLDTASLERFYAQNLRRFDTICASGILVSSQAQAAALRKQVLNGASFASLAKAYSIDKASGARGGALGCFAPPSSSYGAVVSDFRGVGVGGVTKPLPSAQGTYVILMMTSRAPNTFASVVAQVRQAALGADGINAKAAAQALFVMTRISINPAYGSWKVSAAVNGVVVPVLPPTSWIPNASVNRPLG